MDGPVGGGAIDLPQIPLRLETSGDRAAASAAGNDAVKASEFFYR